MPFIKLQFRPGVVKESTQYGSAPHWYDCDYVRFRMGYPEVIGGWQKAYGEQLKGKCRSIMSWSTLSSRNLVFIGTNEKSYVFDGGSFRDITPLRNTVTLAAGPLTSTNGSSIVTVAHTGHGASAGDYVTLSGATTFGGIPIESLNQNFQITDVVDADQYRVNVGVNATSGATGGGSAVVAAYEIHAGLDSQAFGGGWGAGPYSRNAWGSGFDVSIAGDQVRLWSQSNYGEDLIYTPRDSPIYYWDSSIALRGAELSTISGASFAPSVAKEVFVSQERHVMAFGCNPVDSADQDDMLIRFSSKEDYLDWFPDQENSAGDLRIPVGASFITHQQTQSEILVWTESALHSVRYVGAPLYYGISTIANKTTIMGPKAKAAVGDIVFWMGVNKFYRYDGRVSPMPCTLEDYVFSDINLDQSWKVYAASNSSHNEIFFFYPSRSSVEVNRYVCYNYVDNLWYHGSLARTAWLDRSVYQYPFAVSPDGYLYFHEFGLVDGSSNPGTGIPAYIESGPVELGEAGERYMFMDQIIPDLTFRGSTSEVPTATITVTPRRFPGSNTGSASSSHAIRSSVGTIEQFTDLMNIRVRGHQATMKISSNQPGTTWRLGVPRVRVRPDGGK